MRQKSIKNCSLCGCSLALFKGPFSFSYVYSLFRFLLFCIHTLFTYFALYSLTTHTIKSFTNKITPFSGEHFIFIDIRRYAHTKKNRLVVYVSYDTSRTDIWWKYHATSHLRLRKMAHFAMDAHNSSELSKNLSRNRFTVHPELKSTFGCDEFSLCAKFVFIWFFFPGKHAKFIDFNEIFHNLINTDERKNWKYKVFL